MGLMVAGDFATGTPRCCPSAEDMHWFIYPCKEFDIYLFLGRLVSNEQHFRHRPWNDQHGPAFSAV